MGILDLVYPKRCVGCGRTGSYICRECEVGRWEEEQICPTCGRKSGQGKRHSWCGNEGLDGLMCMYAYEGLTRKFIETVKYRRCFDLVRAVVPSREDITDREDLSVLRDYFGDWSVLVVPVPLWPGRERDRGFNQSKIISTELGRVLNVPTGDVLVRVRDTGRQVGRSRKERLAAMKGAFAVNSKLKFTNPQMQRVLLVDDVWTTGATLRECGRVLTAAGFKSVWGWVLAR